MQGHTHSIIINEDTDNLRWYKNENGDEFYLFHGNVVAAAADIRFDLPCHCVVQGTIETNGCVACRSSITAKSINVGQNFYAGGYVEALMGAIRCGSIDAGGDVFARTGIYVDEEIVTGGNLDVKEGPIKVKAGGIRADGHIFAGTNIVAGGLVFAGMDGDKGSADCDNIIRCKAFHGELGYGILMLSQTTP